MKLHTKRWKDTGGAQVLVEESHDIPLVDVEFAFRTGSVEDPNGLEGLTRTMWRVLRMGTEDMTSPVVEERVARLGGRLSIQIASSSVRVEGSVIRRNLEPYVALVAELLQAPAFREKDLARARGESLAELVALRDDDRTLAGRAFRRTLFGAHPYARTVTGTPASLRRIRVADLERHYARQVSTRNLVVGFAGDVREREVRRLLAAHFGGMRRHALRPRAVPAPKAPKGVRVVIVDKPERTQAQVLVGGLGIRIGERDHMPLLIGNTAFGGTFTSRLMQEVREKRGWSYGASAHLGADRQRDAWFMSSAPAVGDAAACVALELSLLEALHAGGLTDAEFERAQRYLVASHCFELDTAMKRLDPRVDEAVFGLPFGAYAKAFAGLGRVKKAAVDRALRRHLPRKDLVVALVATAKKVRKDLAAVPGVASVSVVPYTKL